MKFVLNKAAFRDQVLASSSMKAILESALRASAGPGADVTVDESGPRARARAYGRLADEAASGQLSRVIGGVRV